MTPVLELQDLHVPLRTHRHRGVELVKGVSFSVYPGECLGILGGSGSGKSISTKAAIGLLDHSFHVLGSAKFQGKELPGRSDEEPHRLKGGQVDIILQNPMTCFGPLYRVGAQIAETFAAHGDWNKADTRQRSLEVLERVQVRSPEEVLEKYPYRLSSGMLQRIMTDITTSMRLSLLITDGPTTAIDAITQFEILDELLRIKQEYQTAMVFISHDLSATSRMTNRIVVLNQGLVMSQGDFQRILRHAIDSYTKLLVEKRTSMMRRYGQALKGKERVYA